MEFLAFIILPSNFYHCFIKQMNYRTKIRIFYAREIFQSFFLFCKNLSKKNFFFEFFLEFFLRFFSKGFFSKPFFKSLFQKQSKHLKTFKIPKPI